MKGLKTHAKYILVVLTVAYVTAFSVTQILLGNHMEMVSRVDMAGILANSAPIAAIDARVLQAVRVQGAFSIDVAAVQEEILREAGILEKVARNLYLGRGELKPPGKHVKDRFEKRTFQVEQWIESEPPRFVMETTSLWDALKLFYQNCRRVVHDEVADDMDMRDRREWRYIIRNGIKRMSTAMNDLLDQQTREADDNTIFVENILISSLCVLLIIFTVILAHFWRLLRKVSDERLGLYTVFVSIPRPIVVKLATKKITTGADSDSDSEDDADNNGDAAAPITALMLDAEVQQQHQARNQDVGHNNSMIVGAEHVETGPGGKITPAAMHGILSKNSGAPWTSPGRGGGRLPGRASMDVVRPSVGSGPRRASVDSAYGNRGRFGTGPASDGQQGPGRGAGAGAGEGIYGRPDSGGTHRVQSLARSDEHHSEAHAQVMPGISGRFLSTASSLIGWFRQATRSKVAPELLRHRPGELKTSIANKFAKTGRKLDPAGSQLNVFAIPIMLWGLLVILSFTLTYLQFQEIDAPMRSLGVAARVEVLASTARFYANDLVLAGNPGKRIAGCHLNLHLIKHVQARA